MTKDKISKLWVLVSIALTFQFVGKHLAGFEQVGSYGFIFFMLLLMIYIFPEVLTVFKFKKIEPVWHKYLRKNYDTKHIRQQGAAMLFMGITLILCGIFFLFQMEEARLEGFFVHATLLTIGVFICGIGLTFWGLVYSIKKLSILVLKNTAAVSVFLSIIVTTCFICGIGLAIYAAFNY